MRLFANNNAANLITILFGVQAAAQSAWPQQTFRSTSIQAPYLNVPKHGKPELGHLFFSPSSSTQEWSYPAIYSDDGQLVWQGPNGSTSAFQPQMLDGEPVLAYWQSADYQGYGFGSISILNTSYQEIHHITLPGSEHNFITTADPETFPSYIDIHESQITPEGTILVTAVNITQLDLSPIGGPKNGWVQDGLFYEIDIKTNRVLFRWSTVEHLSTIPLTDTELPLQGTGTSKSNPYGYPHLNSVAKYGATYFLSSRFLCSIILLDKHGTVIWQLHGQKCTSFTLTPGTTFCYQHSPRLASYPHPNTTTLTLHMHNNANAKTFTPQTTLTTGLSLTLHLPKKTITPARTLWDPIEPIFSPSQGSSQPLPNNHVLLQHGATPKLEEYDAHGAVLMRARFGFDDSTQSYRGYRFPRWVGRPVGVACVEEGEGVVVVVYVSWNGATDVKGWRVRMGGGMEVTVVERNGFETRIVLGDVEATRMVVQAVVGGGMGC
ncbi:hypothetical protein BO78DRAFT_304483 [Aspergillus sclerotiicarbonarius CBS 121057]|uniref:Arylsulfotransferase n=1 Tax=Aspergillus sclerotiicarbonarius (strain CBS 121057 / IBT 28362) TaxID=1448318 RepID=A0A319EN33_ASPSB|nr:hypothetical protein BO78DRAFT_304483 [Aspergillus sclerotiicarbonarius CBS 121057]